MNADHLRGWSLVFALAALPGSSCTCKDTPPSSDAPEKGSPVFNHLLDCSLTVPSTFVAGKPMPDHLFEALEFVDGKPTGRFFGVRDLGALSLDAAVDSVSTRMRAFPDMKRTARTDAKGGVLLVFEGTGQRELQFVAVRHGRAVVAWASTPEPSTDASTTAALESLTCTKR